MPQFKDAPAEMNKIMEAAYSSALKKYKGNKAKASKIAIGAAENAGWKKVDGKWTKAKKEMSEIVIDAFKEGEYPQGKFTGKELSEIASTYNPANYEAPILIGHLSDPSYKGKSSIPAFGWIGAAKVVGDHLQLVASQFSDQLKEFIQQGFYKKVSAAFFQPDDPNNPTPGKWHLHHLAFLGGTPPAVKGLEGIAFAEISCVGIEFAEMDTQVTGIDVAEELGTEDTIKDLTESCATFISKIQDVLTSDIDEDTQEQRCSLAAYDLQTEIQGCLDMHWTFTEKLENIEEHNEAEMSEISFGGLQNVIVGERGAELMQRVISNNKLNIQEMGGRNGVSEHKSIKQVLIEMAQSFINKRKETDVDTKKEQEYQAKIAEQDARLKEFAEKERLAKEAQDKIDADKKAADLLAAEEARKTEVKNFCETAIKEGKMTPAMREKDEPIMFELAKTNADALESFQQKYSVPVVPLGTTDIGNGQQDNDKRPQVIKSAEKYAIAHAKDKEFAGLDKDQAISRAMSMHSLRLINFEDEQKLKGAK